MLWRVIGRCLLVSGSGMAADKENSQGGQIVHNAAKMMSAAQTKAVSSGKIPPKLNMELLADLLLSCHFW